VQPAPGIVYTPETENPIDIYVKLLLSYINSKSALQRMVAGLVIVEWARIDSSTRECPEALRTRLHQCLCECVYFDEIALSFTRLLQEARDFVAMLKHYKLPLDSETYGKVRNINLTCKGTVCSFVNACGKTHLDIRFISIMDKTPTRALFYSTLY